MKWIKRRRCAHRNLNGIYGDEVNRVGGWRLQCRDCLKYLDGPVNWAEFGEGEKVTPETPESRMDDGERELLVEIVEEAKVARRDRQIQEIQERAEALIPSHVTEGRKLHRYSDQLSSDVRWLLGELYR